MVKRRKKAKTKKKKVAPITSKWTTRFRRVNGKKRKVNVRKVRGRVQVRVVGKR